MFNRDWPLALVAAALAAVITLAVRRLALARGWALGAIRPRDVHHQPIPRLGGVAVAGALLLVAAALAVFEPDRVRFVAESWAGLDKNLAGILGGTILLLVAGVADDFFGLPPGPKLLIHILAGALLALSGVLIFYLSNPFGGLIVLGTWAPLFVVSWVVLMINAINWLDGLDGLAAGVSLIASVTLYVLAVRPDVNQISMSVLALVLVGALGGFLPFNFWPARVFLGDSGSQVLGFLLAAFAIISGGKLATAALVLGVPLLDTLWVIVRRVVNRQPVYQADRFHLHHRLLAAGLSHRQAVLVFYAGAAALGIVALNTRSLGKFYAGLILLGLAVVGGAALAWRPWLSVRPKAR